MKNRQIKGFLLLELDQKELLKKEKHNKNKLLINILTSFTKTKNIKEIKKNLVVEICKSLDLKACSIFEFDNEINDFLPLDEYVSCLCHKNNCQIYSNGRLQYISRNIFEILKQKNEVVFSNSRELIDKFNIKKDTDEIFQWYEEHDIKAGVYIPIVQAEQVLGVFIFFYGEEKVFSEDELNFFRIIALQFGIISYQVKLCERQEKFAKIEKFENKIITCIINSIDFEETLFLVLNEISLFFKADISCILKIKDGRSILVLKACCQNFLNKINYFVSQDKVQDYLYKNNENIFFDKLNFLNKDYKIVSVMDKMDINAFIYSPFKIGKNKYGLLILNPTENNYGIDKSLIKDISRILNNFIKESKIYNQVNFLPSLLHEFKLPFTTIRGYAQILQEDQPINIGSKNILNLLISSIDRLDSIINNLTILYQMDTKQERENLELKIVELKNIIIDSIVTCSKQASIKNIKIKYELEDIKAVIQEDLIRQAIINLLDNAIKYSPKKSKVLIKSYRNSNNIFIEVIDEGIGVPKQSQNKIFERFYRVDYHQKHENKGSGIGLSLVKNIVELHDGDIEIDSVPNKGSKFTICLPSLM